MKLPGISQPNSAWSRRRFLRALLAAGVGQVLHSNLLRAAGPPTPIFSDVTAEAGITWRQFNGFSPDRYLIETMGGGVGMFDFDNDGNLDIFLLNGGETPRGKSERPLQNALYRNLGNGKFAEVAAEVGLHRVHNYGMGVAVADFDNDGHQDIFITGFPSCTLYHNNGNGTFSEVAKEAGVLDFSGGMGVTFGDFDDDGYLDIYTSNINSNQRWFGEDMTVGQYMRNVLRTRWSLLDAGEYWKVYKLLGPQWMEVGTMIGEGNSLFRNNGDGTFTELKDSHTNRAGWGWSVAFFDMDNDTKLDIYAANGWISNTPDTDL